MGFVGGIWKDGIEGDYRYRGKELSLDVFAALLVWFFDRGTFGPEDLGGLARFHGEHGGIPYRGDVGSLFGRLLSGGFSGYLMPLGDGRYRLDYACDTPDGFDPDVDCPVLSGAGPAGRMEPLSCDRTIGAGDGCVYVYYYDAYRLAYGSDGVWPCKVGMSEGDGLARVVAQVGTAYP